jgi:pullulanase
MRRHRIRALPLLLLAAAFALLVAAPTPAARTTETATAQAARHAESRLLVHYHRPDARYDGWNLWVWPEGGEGQAFPFDGRDDFGAIAEVPFTVTPPRVGFLVRKGNWEAKDFDQDRFVTLTKGTTKEIWLVSGEEAVRTDPKAVDLSLKIVGAFLDAPTSITLATTAPLTAAQRKAIEVFDVREPSKRLRVAAVRDAAPSGGKPIVELELAKPVDPEDVASLALRFPKPFDGLEDRRVFARDVLNDSAFTPLDARLGVDVSRERSVFTTWSPVATNVELLLYPSLDAPAPDRTVALTRGAQGLWTATVPGDLHGTAYRYRFTTYGVARDVPDVHGVAATADSARTVVADLARLAPEGWNAGPNPARPQPTDEVLYEIHVRDFSIRDPRTPERERGTYLGLARRNAETETQAASGLAHLEELGVSAVHLLPVHDFTAEVGEYNWGYWTTLFNVPESNYSADPSDPFAAIRELRAAISALHEAGIRVILDVVYNHTSDAGPDSPFGAAVPHYYFRTTRDGRLVNDTGVGNTFADERPMARKYILDSLEHWLRDYDVDGFRFDLLGCHEPDTVRAIASRLLPLRPDLTLYGEPWTGGGTIRFGKGAQKGLPFAVFNDHLRNVIRGDLDGTAIGVATGPGGDISALRAGIAGAIDDFAREPSESVNYASAHDNLTLWDKIAKTQPNASDAERRAMQKLALGFVLTSQGIAFLHGGCDFARTKGGNHNSYNAGDDVNRFDWERKRAYDDVFDFVAGLVELRRAHPAFRMADDADVRRAIAFLPSERPIAFTIDGTVAGDPWPRILVAYNDEPSDATIDLPRGQWNVVVDATKAGTATFRTVDGRATLPAYSMLVAWQGR